MSSDTLSGQDLISRLETIEGNISSTCLSITNSLGDSLYLIARLKPHAIESKAYFNFGKEYNDEQIFIYLREHSGL